MNLDTLSRAIIATAAAAGIFGGPASVAQNRTPVGVPVFEVDPNFPTMPDNLLLGGVGGATADSHGNVWGIQDPPEDWKVAAQSAKAANPATIAEPSAPTLNTKSGFSPIWMTRRR